jgi:hypothetical protein
MIEAFQALSTRQTASAVRLGMPVLARMIDTKVLIVPSPRWSS